MILYFRCCIAVEWMIISDLVFLQNTWDKLLGPFLKLFN